VQADLTLCSNTSWHINQFNVSHKVHDHLATP
jgi:hypothetical protein